MPLDRCHERFRTRTLAASKPGAVGYYSVRIRTANTPQTLAGIKQVWDQFYPTDLFHYFFLDEFFDQQYAENQRLGTVFGLFAGSRHHHRLPGTARTVGVQRDPADQGDWYTQGAWGFRATSALPLVAGFPAAGRRRIPDRRAAHLVIAA